MGEAACRYCLAVQADPFQRKISARSTSDVVSQCEEQDTPTAQVLPSGPTLTPSREVLPEVGPTVCDQVDPFQRKISARSTSDPVPQSDVQDQPTAQAFPRGPIVVASRTWLLVEWTCNSPETTPITAPAAITPAPIPTSRQLSFLKSRAGKDPEPATRDLRAASSAGDRRPPFPLSIIRPIAPNHTTTRR